MLQKKGRSTAASLMMKQLRAFIRLLNEVIFFGGLICLLSILVGNTVRPCLYKALYEECRLLPSLCACACLSSVLFVFGGGVLTCSA